jgi:3-hydroxyacyl-CoA dehydrogenase
MLQVSGSPASWGLLNNFFLRDRNKKQPGLVDMSLPPRPITTVGIVGAGLMGRSIAEQCLKYGMSVRLLDANEELAQRVAQSLNQSNAEAVQAGSLNHDGPSAAATCEPTTDFNSFSGVDLVIETIVENASIKTGVLKKIEAAVGSKTLIASNTSAIPIATLAGTLKSPRNFCGIHFCHPELMALVEVVCGPQTAEQTLADAVGFVRSLKKMAVAMNDGPGFVVNRLLAAMIDEAFRILTAAGNSGTGIGEIDAAMREFGFRGGPFEIIDVVGADTCWYAGRTMFEAGSRCVTLSPILPKMVKLGRLGRKTGQGFYQYPDPLGQPVPDPKCHHLIEPYLPSPADSSPKFSAPEITTRIVSAMVLEATRILDESLVADFRDIELCVIEGFGFPKHRGGILYWADSVGLETVLQTLQTIATDEPRLQPSERLQSMVRNGENFYGQPACR